MPILPLDHPEPFAATLGVMLYPGTEDDDPQKARTFAARWLAEPIKRAHQAGHRLSYEALLQIAVDGGELLDDLDDRFWGGTATGELFKALYILAKNEPALASWENAIRVYEVSAVRSGSKGSRASLYQERSRFRSVTHLWAA